MSDPVAEAVSKALTEVLEALATLAMETQMFPRNFTPLVEEAFVRAVDREAERLGQPLPDASTVTARTGLHRNLVRKIRSNASPKASSAGVRLPQTLRVLHDWKTDPEYLNEADEPKVLPLRGPVSFNELVKRHGAGLRARAILKELERIKAVRRVGERQVEMLDRHDIHRERKAQAIRDLGEYAGECLETLVHNVINPETPRYYRRVVGLHVDDEKVPRLVRDASSEAGVWALGMQEAITDRSVTVKPNSAPRKATRLSGHFFISERPTVVAPMKKKTPEDKAAVMEQKRKR